MTKNTSQRWNGYFAFSFGFITLLLLIVLLGVWGTQSKISGAVIAPGLVKVESNRQVIQHPEGGIVNAIYAKNGDYVEIGQVVLTFDDADIVSELLIIEQQIVETSARIARLKAERDGRETFNVVILDKKDAFAVDVIEGQRHLFDASLTSFQKELEQIDEQIVQTREQITGVKAQLSAVDIQINLMEQEISANQSLKNKGLLIHSKLLEQQRAFAKLKGERGALIAQRGQHFSSIASFELNKIRLENTRREKAIVKLRDIESNRAELIEKQKILNRKRIRHIITAPMSGIVYGSEVFALRSVVSPAKPIMYIIPQDQALIISARIPVSNIDQVSVGQDVALRFSALNQKFTPEILGKITTISADIIIDKATGKPYYEAEILPLEEELAKLGDQTLIPGMLVDAYIKSEARSPLNYLTKPFTDYFYRAFREK